MRIINYTLLAGCLLLAATASAQQKLSPDQEDKTDYRVIGSPMPRLKVRLYRDTVKRAITAADAQPATTKKRKHKEDKEASSHKEYLTGSDLDNGANLFVMLFSPGCGHCQEMAKIIEANIGSFKKSHLVLIASAVMSQYLYDFSELTKTYEYPAINIGIDSSGFVDKTFLYQMLPQFNIYNKERKLLKTYTGDTPFDSLRQYIQ